MQTIIEHLAKRPSPPQKSSTKATLQKFATSYSRWTVKLNKLTAEYKPPKHYSELTGDEARERVTEAEAVLRAEYWADIRGLADEIKSELTERLLQGESGEPLRGWLIERIEQSVDNHHNVIYTYAAQKVLLYSDNAGAYVEEFGDEGLAEGGDINWNRLAWAAMRRDVGEQLNDAGIDVNDPDGDSTCDSLEITNAIIKRLDACDKLKDAAELLESTWEDDYIQAVADSGNPDYSILDFAADVIHDNITADNRAELARLI